MSASVCSIRFVDTPASRVSARNFASTSVQLMPRGPDPWGRRFVGRAAVREGLKARFEGLPDVHYGADSHYVKPDEGLGAASPAGREDRLRRLLRDLPLTVRRGQGMAVLTTTPGSANSLASAIDAAGWPEVIGTLAGDDTIFAALALQPRAYGGLAQRLARLGAYVQPED